MTQDKGNISTPADEGRKRLNVAVLGSTGSIGTQTLDIIAEYPERFRASVLSANSSWEALAEQARRFRPDAVVIADKRFTSHLMQALDGSGISVYGGPEILNELVCLPQTNIVMAAMVGYSGLASTVAAAKAGKRIALANKETLVAAGSIIKELCRRHHAELIPVDSEHSAIFQCLRGEEQQAVERIILTASGGPFRTFTAEQLQHVTPAQALKHPNWQMGRKVTIDSASMMNKGFEMIEARWLFDCDPTKIDIAVHPQSIVHSMVEFVDGSIKAQLGVADMRLPIRYALGFPQRLSSNRQRLKIREMSELTFEEADRKRFPMLNLAYEAIAIGGTMPAILAAADEVAVPAFLNCEISFTGMAQLAAKVMQKADIVLNPDYDAIIDADAQGRRLAYELLHKI